MKMKLAYSVNINGKRLKVYAHEKWEQVRLKELRKATNDERKAAVCIHNAYCPTNN